MYDLIHLLEAAYFLLQLKLQNKGKTEADIEVLKKTLYKDEKFEWIDNEEMVNPESVLSDFVEKYEHKYVRTQLKMLTDLVTFIY